MEPQTGKFFFEKFTSKRDRDISIIYSILIKSQHLMTDSLLIYVICTSCEPEIVLPVIQIKSIQKQLILCSRFVQNT